MSAKTGITIASSILLFATSVALSGCAKPPPQRMLEQPVPQPSQSPSPPPAPTEMPELPPPKLEQVQEAVKRIFKDAVVIDSSRKPGFLVGDFNGDQSQDLAVVLKPAEGMLSELNQEFPNWIAREPLEEILAKSKPLANPTAPKRLPNPASGQTVRFEQNDLLLAVIHGFGPSGWHDSQATQTHLLRDVVGTNMRVLPYKEAVKVYKGTKPFPNVFGDLIQETLIGQSGFLHFAGTTYGWYDPKNYKAVPGPVHRPMSGMR